MYMCHIQKPGLMKKIQDALEDLDKIQPHRIPNHDEFKKIVGQLVFSVCAHPMPTSCRMVTEVTKAIGGKESGRENKWIVIA